MTVFHFAWPVTVPTLTWVVPHGHAVQAGGSDEHGGREVCVESLAGKVFDRMPARKIAAMQASLES